jgi:hypothetical protein
VRSLRHQNVCGYLGTERTEVITLVLRAKLTIPQGDAPGTKILNILLEYVPGGESDRCNELSVVCQALSLSC